MTPRLRQWDLDGWFASRAERRRRGPSECYKAISEHHHSLPGPIFALSLDRR